MSISQETQLQVSKILWDMHDLIRGKVDIEDSRDIVLALFFLKAVSDQYDVEYEKLEIEYGDIAKDDFTGLFRFFVPKEARFSFLFESVENGDNANRLKKAFHTLEQNNIELTDLFYDAELVIERLGSIRSNDYYFRELIKVYSRIDLRPSIFNKGTEVGEIFIQLIQRYASVSGNKGREYFTPHSITKLMSELLLPSAGDEIYDPTCGSASLLVALSRGVSERNKNSIGASIYGQENYISNFNLARMNLLLNGVDDSQIRRGDPIKNPAFLDSNHLKKFDVVASVPPFSMKMWGDEYAINDSFGRFKWGIPPKSKGDYAFISHMLASLKENKARMAVVVPHGVLFRGGAEGKIRTNIIGENLLDTVIGLPQNLFFGTSIPTVIMIFNKSKAGDSVLFVDASKEYEARKNHNSLSEENISKILKTFNARSEVVGFARNVSIKEIIDNDFNLNISRYIYDYNEEVELNLGEELAIRATLQCELKALECEMESLLSQIVT